MLVDGESMRARTSLLDVCMRRSTLGKIRSVPSVTYCTVRVRTARAALCGCKATITIRWRHCCDAAGFRERRLPAGSAGTRPVCEPVRRPTWNHVRCSWLFRLHCFSLLNPPMSPSPFSPSLSFRPPRSPHTSTALPFLFPSPHFCFRFFSPQSLPCKIAIHSLQTESVHSYRVPLTLFACRPIFHRSPLFKANSG
jgi:hypothetical protein